MIGGQVPGLAPHPFDTVTAVAPSDLGWAAETSDRYWAFVGPFGGATAATLLRAVLAHPESQGDPLALTVNFCAPIERGGFRLEPRLDRANRSNQHWSVVLSQAPGGVLATASVVLASRRPSFSHQAARMPPAPPRESLPMLSRESIASWVQQYTFRFVSGEPVLGAQALAEPANARSVFWLSDRVARVIDVLSLCAMSDAFFGRIFHVLGAMVPFGTVSMTTYFHADARDLAAQSAEAVLCVGDAHVFHKSYCDQTGELWSPSGRLLATTHQIGYFKA